MDVACYIHETLLWESSPGGFIKRDPPLAVMQIGLRSPRERAIHPNSKAGSRSIVFMMQEGAIDSATLYLTRSRVRFSAAPKG